MSTVNIPRAAALLCVHPKTVEDLIHDGTLPAAKIGRAWVLMERDVLDYINQQVIAQTQKRRTGVVQPKRRAA